MTPPGARVVVGDDGSDQAGYAVRWAAERAAEVDGVLRLVHVAAVPVMTGLGWKVDASMEAGRLLRAMEQSGHALLGRRCLELTTDHPGLRLDTAVLTGDPREVLLREAESADLLVLGPRGHGRVSALLLGSVSSSVARHAPCATVVARPPRAGAVGVTVVVGPADDAAALRFAAGYAVAHDEPLRVIRLEPSGRRGPLLQSSSWCEAELETVRRRHPEIAVVVEDDPRTAVDALADTSGDRVLVVAERSHRRYPHDRAVGLAEHCRCPVALIPARTG